ncbi:hypothetical protein [Photobacterium nomapromontoriensis]|uniref:leucine-rich repeat domain-containing protein n=1 Tax=Photobacterium nomapromontoriensis TaxID=2910237 RepID=UPI003D0AFA52
MSKSRLSFRITEKLSQIHPDVDYLTIDTDENIISWQAIANAFPNVTSIKISELAKVGEKHNIDADFFSAFPALERFITDSDQDLDTDFTDVSVNLLSQLSELKLELCSNTDLSVLGCLAKLKTLEVTVKSPTLRFHAQAESGLEEVALTLTHHCHALDIDLSTAPINTLKIKQRNHYRLDQPSAVTIDTFALPACLSELTIDIMTKAALPQDMLSHVSQLNKLTLEQQGGTISEYLLGDVAHITQCTLKLKDITTPVPASLFAKLASLTTLSLALDNTQLEQDFLPQALPLEEFYLHCKDSDLTPLLNTNLPKLHTAWLNWHHEQLPVWLAHSPQLTNVDLLFNGDISAMPVLPSLTRCTLRGTKGDQLPETLRHNANIHTLNLLNCAYPALGDISAMTALENIWIQPWEDDQALLPNMAGISELPALKTVRLDIIPTQIDPIWLQLAPQVELDLWHQHLATELAILRSANLPFEQCLAWSNTLVSINKPAELPAMPTEFHLTLMAAKYNRFKAQHKIWLRQVAKQSEQQKPLDNHSVIFISGRSAFKAAELKAKSAELGFTLSKKLDASVSHVLLGSAPKSIELLNIDRHLLIDDTSLQTYFTAEAPKFLQQADAGVMGDSVLAMLTSPDEASHQVAVQMLEQGGVTEAMRLPLFFILKTTSDNKLRKQIKQLLAGMGDEPFQLAVNDRILFNACRGLDKYGRLMGQGVMVDKLKKQKKKWGEALCNQFAKLYFARFGEGLIGLMMQKETSTEQLDALSTLIDGDCLNWRRGAAFEQMLAHFDEHSIAHYQRHINCSTTVNYDNLLGAAKTYLPQELAQNHTVLALDLGHCLLDALPKGIEHYRHIHRLNLTGNALTKLPDDFALFGELEELSLSHNHFTAFPEVLMKLPNLNRLDLRCARKPVASDDYISTYTYQGGTSREGAYRPIRAPQAFRDAFPNCEILEDI